MKHNTRTFDGISVGDQVIDRDGHRGIVVRIREGVDVENHGTITVWQLERYEYGADNCEHYCAFGWRDSLKIEK